MKNCKRVQLWRLGLIMVMLSIGTMPNFAGAVSQIPTSPITGHLKAGETTRTPDYYTTANWANSPPLAKFVDTLPGLGSGKANNLGQYLTVGKPDITTYPGSDYYEIELREFHQRMHSDLPAPGTLLRGYVQVNRGTNLSVGTLPSQNKCGADQHACTAADTAAGNGIAPDPIRYLGPTLVSERDRPVRVKFTNKLPIGSAGDLFVPTDLTVMGAGTGPANADGSPCNNTADGNTCASYTQNRATIHLHGGRTPWISDGTPHQWITPALEITPFKKGVSAQNVPDMPDPGDGSMTFYYTNQQSARLMFYHDHAFGTTRLNVYVGEVAGYLITDQYEQDLIARGIIPPDQIPLILQDKTFVDATPTAHPVSGLITPKIRITDPLWNWGSGTLDGGDRSPVTGDLWLPHVYMPAQTSTAGIGGVNPFGRWMYGPWFYPATVVTKGPVANPYYDPNCSSSNPLELAQCQTPGQPEKIPGTPNVSMGMEAFQDSAVVNGTAFPSLTVDARVYRFRILNGASDRFWNLSFYEADPTQISLDHRPASRLTEVKMLPASPHLAAQYNWPEFWPVDGRDGGVPDPALMGPSFLQIGTEGGFLPQPVVIDPQPITYNTDPTAFWVGNVDKMGLALGPAERADVIVDFSKYAGKTLILYNDAPAAWPARVAGYDYYTGAPDLRDSGGFGTGGEFNKITGAWEHGTGPLIGYAPNTRTVMQVIVRPVRTVVDDKYTFNRADLDKEFTAAAPVTAVNPDRKTLFERAQEPIIVGQASYKDAYPNSYFPLNFPWEGIAQINDSYLKFVTLAGEEVTAPTHPKGIHDEMGASFDPVYGRMSGNLGMQLPNPTTLNALLILYGFSDIPTENINNSTQVNVTVLSSGTQLDPFLGVASNLNDGTQIWKISHNGVDTHPIHFHIFDVQLINRVGWDGQILMPEPNELGWKDTVKISPLEDTIVAVRPRAPALPFGITNSLRPLNPSIPIDSAMGFNGTPSTGSNWPIPLNNSTTGSGFSSIDWKTGQAYIGTPTYPYLNYKGVVTNIIHNFGWEYVWHCHILSHEEMDMMRPIVLNVVSSAPDAPSIKSVAAGVITWADPTAVVYTDLTTFGNPKNEIGYNVYRSIDGTNFTKLNTASLPANSTSYTDTTAASNTSYVYRVDAFNASGTTQSPVASMSAIVVTANGTFNYANRPFLNQLSATIVLPTGVSIASVEFLVDGASVGIGTTIGTTSTLTSWNPTETGTHSITARVINNQGVVVVSSPVIVTVIGTFTADFTIKGSANGTDIGYCETITFSSTATGTPNSYTWTINNGGSFTSGAATSTATATLVPGTYLVTLSVVGSDGTENSRITKSVNVVNHNPTAIPGATLYTIFPGDTLALTGSGTDPDTCDTLSFAWNIDNIGPYELTGAIPAPIPNNALNTLLGNGTHTITFKVTDSKGGVGTATTMISIEVKDGLIPGYPTHLMSALRALQITNGKIAPTALELAHGDVAPYFGSASHPDGKINLGDVSVLLMRVVGSIPGF